MSESGTDAAIERWRQYLLLLARVQLGPARRGQPEASDLVQQTLLDAFRCKAQFRGTTEAEHATWFRKILACNLADALRANHREKRDVKRERSLQSSLDQSSVQLASLLAAPDTSPSIRAGRNEQLTALADAMASLSEASREAIVLHYFQGWSLDRIGLQLERTPAAVAGLLKRGLKQLRELLIPEVS
ncbi:MAG: sigma-70 family RNA polymerase sigma factor [Gemmataceae bacterium]